MKKNKASTHQFFLKKNLGGFTLIELLVVIAIIGLLAAIIITFLSANVRGRARDARIANSMAQIRTIAAQYQDYTNPNLCNDSRIRTLRSDIEAQGGSDWQCNTSSTAYCVKVKLNQPNKWWCIDSTLKSGEFNFNPTACSLTSYKCEQGAPE